MLFHAYRSVWLSVVLVAAAATISGCDSPVLRGDRVAFSLRNASGDVIGHDDPQFSGKVLIIDLWGSWCIPCHEQTPHLVRFYEDYHGDGLEIVGISFELSAPDDEDERRRKLNAFRDEYDIPYYLVTGGAMGDIEAVLPDLRNVSGLPVTIFVGRDGRVAAVETGFKTEDAARHEARIVDLLAEPEPE